jgi:hypothetical protein
MSDLDTNHARAVRYRQLAMAEADRSIADILFRIADEADRDVLCTSDRSHARNKQGGQAKPLTQSG